MPTLQLSSYPVHYSWPEYEIYIHKLFGELRFITFIMEKTR